MDIKKVNLEFGYDFKGIMKAENHETNIQIFSIFLSI